MQRCRRACRNTRRTAHRAAAAFRSARKRSAVFPPAWPPAVRRPSVRPVPPALRWAVPPAAAVVQPAAVFRRAVLVPARPLPVRPSSARPPERPPSGFPLRRQTPVWARRAPAQSALRVCRAPAPSGQYPAPYPLVLQRTPGNGSGDPHYMHRTPCKPCRFLQSCVLMVSYMHLVI